MGDGKYELLVPVGLPDEGTFQWLDLFQEKNPQYTEISSRSILSWAEKSGLYRFGDYKKRNCNDKPDMNLDCPPIDSGGLERMMKTFASMQGRNYVIMEVRNNLIEQERTNLLNQFPSSMFRKVAHVQIGEEASPEFKKKTQDVMLHRKQEIENATHQLKLASEKKQKKSEYNKKVAERAKAKPEKERKKKDKEL